MDYKVIYPSRLDSELSPTNEAEVVYTGYNFSRRIQQYMLDYCYKIYSGLPLSDEVVEDPFDEK